MIVYLLEAIIAGTASYFLYDWHWWAVTITFPILMMFGNQMFKVPMARSRQRLYLDSLMSVVQIGYVISQVVLFQINIGHWYGWLLGLIVGWLMMGLMTPRRWQTEVRAEM